MTTWIALLAVAAIDPVCSRSTCAVQQTKVSLVCETDGFLQIRCIAAYRVTRPAAVCSSSSGESRQRIRSSTNSHQSACFTNESARHHRRNSANRNPRATQGVQATGRQPYSAALGLSRSFSKTMAPRCALYGPELQGHVDMVIQKRMRSGRSMLIAEAPTDADAQCIVQCTNRG